MARGPLGALEVEQYDHQHTVMTQATNCLDGSIGTVLASLGSRAANTIVIYLSDNGYLYGEHRRNAKKLPYEEAVHVPMVIRYPGAVPTTAPFATDALVGNIDVAPTIADLVGFDWKVDGRSLVPLLTTAVGTVRDAFLVEGCQGAVYPCDPNPLLYVQSEAPSYNAVVLNRYKYIAYATGEIELYDRVDDPDEMVNLHGEPQMAALEATLAARLATERAPVPADTTIATGPSGAITTRTPTFTYFGLSYQSRFECRTTTRAVVGAWVACNGGTFTAPALGNGTTVFEVRSFDENGSVDATPASRSVTITTGGPNVSITSGPAATTKVKTATFKFKSTTAGTTFECRSGLVGALTPWAPCSSPVVYSALTDATRIFETRSVTGSGSVSTIPAARMWKVDSTGPSFTFVDQPVKPTRAASEHFAFYADDALSGVTTCQIDTLPAVDCSSGYFDTGTLAEGSHTLRVAATNTLTMSGSTSSTWRIDRTPAAITVTSSVPNGGTTTSSNIQFTITANEQLDFDRGRACTIDGQNQLVGVCGATTSFFGLSPGIHTFSVQGYDEALNASAPVGWTWTVL